MKKLALLFGLLLSTAAFAQHGGGGGSHGGGYGGGAHGGSYGGSYAGGWHGGYAGWHGGYGGYGGWHGGYGYRGWYGGYRGWYGGYGWGWGGLGFGVFAATLPLYYSTYWWNGVPYYYAYNNYYLWNPSMGGYVTVDPPSQVRAQVPQNGASGAPAAADLFAYPKSGQTSEQQATDRFQCHEWAVKQTGFDPSASVATSGGVAAGAPAGQRSDYMRAQAACLEGRGYSVQ